MTRQRKEAAVRNGTSNRQITTRRNKVKKIITAIGAAACAACANGPVTEGHHGHEHEHEGIIATAYTSGQEIYAEGHEHEEGEVEIAVHVTRLSDFGPDTTGGVTLVMGGREIETERTATAGIYEASVSMELDEIDRMTFIAGGETATVKAESPRHISNGATFSKENSWRMDFRTDECRMAQWGRIIHGTSYVTPSTTDEKIIVAKVSGLVSIERDIQPGMLVTAGATLLSITNGTLEGDMSVREQETRMEYERAKYDYERLRPLDEEHIVSHEELHEAQVEYERAKAAWENMQNVTHDGRTEITSGVSGYVRDIAVTNGQHVEAGDPLLTVFACKRLTLRVELPASHHAGLGDIADVNFVIGDSVMSLRDLKGRIVSVGRTTTENSPLIPVTMEVEAREGLTGGTFVDTYLTCRPSREVLTVDRGALIEEMGSYFVFVQVTPEYFEKRQVTLGQTDGERTEVQSGLKAGERIVSRGAMLVKLAMTSGTLDAHSGHVH